MIGWFHQLSIRRKLTVVLLFTSFTAVLLSSGTMFVCHALYLQRSAERELKLDAEIIAAHISAAVAFRDKAALDEILNALERRPNVWRATVFDPSGLAIAEYISPVAHTQPLPPSSLQLGLRRGAGFFVSIGQSIHLDDDQVGTVSILCSLEEERSKMAVSGSILLLALTIATAMAMVLSLKLQRLISDPLLELAALAKRVTVKRDYSLRATGVAKDETGVLVEVFNEMLSEIQKRDIELRTSEQRFRQIAEAIQEVFWIVDVESRRVLYVSPAYEKIWGRTCEDLYANQEQWLDTVHPDDRERFLMSYVKDFTNNYDEEFRIVRPDGSIRWIHIRGFAISDEGGRVYRVVGISEDITVRKQLEKEVLEISDREQSRIGQDVHDSLCQHLVRIGFATNVLQNELDQQHHPQCSRVKKIADLVDQAISQARHLARGLYPVKLETKGLRSALEELAAFVSDDHGIQCSVQCTDDVEVKEYAVAIHLYRICQEAVTNAIKHASPSEIVVLLAIEQNKLMMAITDNGIGMSHKDGGMGINIMNYRARMIGAVLDIKPGFAGGTVVSCAMNLQSQTPREWEPELTIH